MNTSHLNLGDSHLELVDPTPNIHSLFVQFNAKFFWGKLDSVSVRWSKRMFSCAGICRYEGRGGLCDIGLSEPLLKLRPRKDLVETLLHEMIHAYLFVAERDRDRDGHGPNFQFHMHRINKAANINISIYHNFHDEVRLYLTHWWRCDGPCQHRKPFFGLVKRSSNRAPGPNDFWWQQHQSTCGGKFNKIKEPEKSKKSEGKKNKENVIKNSDKVPVNVITISDLPSTSQSSIGSKFNGGKTVVLTKRPSDTLNTPAINTKRRTLTDYWSGKGNTLKTEKIVDKNENVTETVRNHWANKDLNLNNKRFSNPEYSDVVMPSTKATKLNLTLPQETVSPPDDFTIDEAEALLKDIYGDTFTLNRKKYEKKFSPPKPKHGNSVKAPVKKEIQSEENFEITEVVDCPSCNKKVQSSEINEHLDVCVSQPLLTECLSCHTMVENMDTHSSVCFSRNVPDFVECPSCQEIVSNINDHLDTCLEHNRQNLESVTESNRGSKIPKSEIEKHLDDCLVDDSKLSENKCPVCSVHISESLEDHLEVCSALIDTFLATSEEFASLDDDDFNDSGVYNASGTMHPCPCCMKMIEGALMNSHIDKCLNL